MLVLFEGLDKTGKSTVAEHFRKQKRFEYVHMSTPAKWHTRDTYFAEMLHLIAMTAGKNVVIDRTWYGELVWPQIFGREPLLNIYDCSALTAICRSLHGYVDKYYMHDPDHQAHLARIAKFKEPGYNFANARRLYEEVRKSASFSKLTFKEAEAKGWT